MTDTITILQSKGPLLTKRWTPAGIEPYGRAKHFQYREATVNDVRALSLLLQQLEGQPTQCVIRGAWAGEGDPDSTTRDLDHFHEQPHRWVCLDVDSWPLPEGVDLDEPDQAVLAFIQDCLPAEFQEVTHHWQLSSSAGKAGAEHVLKAHIWFWLDRRVGGHELEAWARGLALPVDVTVFRTVQVHYTAAPVIDPGVVCPITRRSGLTEGMLGDEVAIVLPTSAPGDRQRGSSRTLVDPRDKPGIHGTFCRLYPPARVIDDNLCEGSFEWEGDSGARISWTVGDHPGGGLCVTDDELHIYNSHSSDPFEGRACNAWDFVRVHRFGHLDDSVDAGAVDWLMSNGGLPSETAMRDWARGLDDVAAELHETSIAREADEAAREEAQRQARVQHLDTLRQGVQACMDVEALKRYIQDVLRKDDTIDDTDRNGALTVAVQDRFKDLGSPQKREDVRRLLRPAAGPGTSGAAGPAWLSRWIYVSGSDRFFNLDTKVTVTGRGFDAINSQHMPLAQDGVHRESAADWAINVWHIREVSQTLYAPGQDEVFEILGTTWGNEYREDTVPAAGPGGEAAIRMVEGHLARLFPDERERGILLSWMAHNVRHPGRKIRWAPYVYGAQGTGKTFIGELLGMVMGDVNTRVLAGSTLQSPFNGWCAGHALVTIEEVYQAGHLYETEEKLKAPIANNAVDVHRKGKDSYRAPNFTNYLLLSNHPDGIPVGENDRRFFFLRCAVTGQQAKALAEEGYFDDLFETCRTSVPGLRRWLLEEVGLHPEFDPDGRAPVTAAREQVIEMSKSDAEVALETILEGQNAASIGALAGLLEASGAPATKSRALTKMLASAGWEFFGVMRVEGKPARVYVRSSAGPWTNESVRAALALRNRACEDWSEQP